MEDALALTDFEQPITAYIVVLILVLMEDALALFNIKHILIMEKKS